ncbi:MAG: ABC transporter permease [Chloroflexota bacterium]|nr:ABC transporter permease [Chloroflexota bacterium]
MLEAIVEAWQFVVRRPELVGQYTLAHMWLVFVAGAIALVLGVGSGIFISGRGRERLAEVALYIAEIMMTVPSLALFGLLMLILGGIGLKAIGFLPAVLALIVYGQLPVLRNTYTAIRQVDPALIEVGRGMGMTETQVLLRVKFPLALPVVMAGVRNSLVLLIGIATIAAFIGAGGLGVPIFRGLTNNRMDLIIVGGVTVSILALVIDGLMTVVQRLATPRGLKKR